ncbi:sugar ABC transporter permease [Brachybacterium sp. MASK1Z-5]|uniref:Sugar ABC transporter permease n=1 Tax=Brachybacterium halotolerans TaxID=2795215 RepID=A0ABS1BEF4_9MICO|nr:sugar ABC transporter permease [Brachybacterium halotolerans]MBK0333024.1 sugar ABC transporter permease [Brachybacterium halotolerans]
MTALAAPALVLMVVVNAYPVVYAASQSLRDGNLLDPGDFVGLQNFTEILSDPLFWRAVRFTLLFTVSGVLGSWAIGYALALAFKQPFRGRGVLKVAFLLPWVVPVVVTSMSWNWLVATAESPLPRLFAAIGLPDVLFLADPTMAVAIVCVFKVWISFPFMFLMMSAAMEGIDPSVYEASTVDGAGRWATLTRMTLPLTAKSTYISWVLMSMFTINDFPTVFLLTGGGPVDATTSLVVLAYRTVFQSFQPGYGVGVAFIMTAALVAISLALFRSIRKVD